MSWTDIFPVLDEDLVEEFMAEAPEREREQSLDHVAVAERINSQPEKMEVAAFLEVAAFALFWKHDHPADPDSGDLTREMLMNAPKLGLVRRSDPWRVSACDPGDIGGVMAACCDSG